jgi:hypothetical protein
LYRRLGGPQGQSGWLRKISPPPGFDPRTVQPVASRYTDYAIPAQNDRYATEIPCLSEVMVSVVTHGNIKQINTFFATMMLLRFELFTALNMDVTQHSLIDKYQ